MKDIKDYLPFLLGQQFEVRDQDGDIPDFIGKLTRIDATTEIVFVIETEIVNGKQEHSYEFFEEHLLDLRVKPILRPLSDRTKIELEDYNNLGHSTGTSWGDIELQAKRTALLLKQGFDLFGLIPAGLAIDKTKFNERIK